MPLSKATPFRFQPKTVSDTVDGSAVGNGAMHALKNLVPSPTTANLWVCRPAAVKLTSFPGFTTPGTVSCIIVNGDYIIGMVQSARYTGKDEPFVYNIKANSFSTVSGTTAANCPTTQPTTGDWKPPQLALVGKYVCVAHPGYDGATYFTGWIDITNLSSPAYSAGNCATNPLAGIPSSVVQFSGRAWYMVNPPGVQPAVQATDSLDPKTRTNGGYALTFGDFQPLTAMAPLPLDNQLGGIVQALMVFKGTSNIYQILGDFATPSNPISLNTLNVATGTLAPNSLCSTPKGLAFIAPDGLRIIDDNAQVSDPVGEAGQGVSEPFRQALYPSRISGACNASKLRFSVQNGATLGQPFEEYWFDLDRSCWSGPHSFPSTVMEAYQSTFVMAATGAAASLWQSDPVPSTTSVYTENGVPMTWTYDTAYLPERGDMHEVNVIETLLYCAFDPAAGTINCTFNDQYGHSLAVYQIAAQVGTLPMWGTAVWGQFNWGGPPQYLAARQVPWPKPVIFDRAKFTCTGGSSSAVQVGDTYFNFKPLGYLPPAGS